MINLDSNVFCLKVCCNHRDWNITYRPLVSTSTKFYTTIYGQVISSGELAVKAQYLCYTKENTTWYWKQQPLQYNIIFITRIILHPCLDVTTIRYVQDIPNNVCNRIQAKNPYKDILFVWLMLIMIIFRMNVSAVKKWFERNVSVNSDKE